MNFLWVEYVLFVENRSVNNGQLPELKPRVYGDYLHSFTTKP